MLDILLKQMELQDVDKHTGLNSSLCKNVCWLLKCMITTAWIGTTRARPNRNAPLRVQHHHILRILMTATVETRFHEQLDLAAIIPAEKVVSAVARAITLSESGRSVDDLPQPLQYIHQLLLELSKVDKPDVLYYMLQCLNMLILHGDACTKPQGTQGFFIWCQENLLIKHLWGLCNSEHSHICQTVVPLLLHCITLPAGSDVFWRVIQEAFHNRDWCARFTAVER
ncbi:hypothetical protein NQ318_006865 [Aromia moschata]|uniref:Huntingtin n=1 Tax=Aromia moschata TaxID=1265417 RepID=A0AAV8YKI4_9CUCU|nr:hypothetical protein NQ318_006865 [Aromia moschata]